MAATMDEAGTVAVILVAAGQSRRFGGATKKIFADLLGRPVWRHSFDLFYPNPQIGELILVVAAEDQDFWLAEVAPLDKLAKVRVVLGGQERFHSVQAGLAALQPTSRWVLIHDAARPCLKQEWIDLVIARVRESGVALLARRVVETVKEVLEQENSRTVRTIPRQHLWFAQTPQAFQRELLLAAYQYLPEGVPITDDIQLVETQHANIQLVESDATNIKITEPFDLILAATILQYRQAQIERHP